MPKHFDADFINKMTIFGEGVKPGVCRELWDISDTFD
jgi:hypothetical protein